MSAFRCRNRLYYSLLLLLWKEYFDADTSQLIEPKDGQNQDEGGGQEAEAELVERCVTVSHSDVAECDVHSEDPPGYEDDA